MPFLRSQTRGSHESKSTSYATNVNSMASNNNNKSVTLNENSNSSSTVSSRSASPLSTKSSNTMFPFPPAPVLATVVPSSSSNANIINISNVSSESASESSSVSIRSTSHSNPSSPLLEETEFPQSRSLNDAMVEDSLVDLSRSSSVILQELSEVEVLKSAHSQPISTTSASVGPTQCNSLPAFLAQSMILQAATPVSGSSATTPLVYIPVSEPSALQEDRDRALQMVLQQHQCYDDEAGMNLRRKIITELDTLVKQWIRSEGLGKHMAWSHVEQVGGKVVSYGSYKLSVVDKESDLDLLCVVPKHVSREDFFTNLYDQLFKKDEVTELRQLSSAYVPVIKMKYRGVEVDLTMARIVCFDRVPEEESFLLTPAITQDMDPRCLRSLNGYRATCELLQLVPNVERFRLTLRVVKLWARRNGLYGNMLGFLGGASWAILVAKVCQLAGSEGSLASCSSLIYQFFYTWAHWDWPKPVYIKRVELQPFPAWNPAINHLDREHAMPIITSSVPQMNSAVNVSKTNCQLIKTKCAEALITLQGIIDGSRSWADLFLPSRFFEEFNDYIMVTSSCLGDSSLWFGSVEAKLRQLNNHIGSSTKVLAARIWPQPFERKDGTSLRQMWFIGLKMMVGQSPEVVQEPLHYFTDLCMSTVGSLGSRHAASFSVSWQQVGRGQLGSQLTRQQMAMGRDTQAERLSYAAVTLGSAVTSCTQLPSSVSSSYSSTVAMVSPSPGSCQLSHPPPYNRVFSAGHLPGQVAPPPNYIVYSTQGAMVPGQVLSQDQYHHGSHGAGQKMTIVPRPPSHMLTLPPNRSLTSPQPGGYHTSYSRPQPSIESLLRSRSGAAPLKSPQTPGGGQQPPRSSPGPYIPAPGPGSVPSYPRAVPQLPSYPPPPISPMSQFNSPPPPVPKLLVPPPGQQPPGGHPALQRADSRQDIMESQQTANLRVPAKRPKDVTATEDTRLRSVSNSSDKFPPASLHRARVTHQDQLPVSPGPGQAGHQLTSGHLGGHPPQLTGVVPLPPVTVDTSVPPPSIPTPPPSLSPPPISFNMAKKKAWRTGRSPRISVSEICDVRDTPQPVRGCRASNPPIKFSLSTRRAEDNVFENF